MAKYLVTWKIDVEADSPREAALKALEIQRDPDSIAVIFNVQEGEGAYVHDVDLFVESRKT